MVSEDAIDITVQVTAGSDRFERVTIFPNLLGDQELGKLVRAKITHLLMLEQEEPVRG